MCLVIKLTKKSNSSHTTSNTYEMHIDIHLSGIQVIEESQIEIKNRLGSGQFGEVYHAVFNSANIALKVCF